MDIMNAIDAVEVIDALYPECPLPPFDPYRVYRASRSIKAATGIGLDHARPWHFTLTSSGARAGLVALLTAVERLRRWPSLLRWTIAHALGKKSGGARLIGITSSVYRLWARIRYWDCRAVLEARIQRPYLVAAPAMGAERTAVEFALAGEVAASRGLHSAASSHDLKKFYEHVSVADFCTEALKQGVPRIILLLTSHMYTGPRLVSVRDAVGPALYPRRSIIAGCSGRLST